MKISKAGLAGSGGTPDEAELALIRRYARGEVEAEQLYTFPVILCDNDIDRDFERFDEKTLENLAELFVGKTGITDHDWSSKNQVARIYRTEVLREPGRKTAAGDGYVFLKAWAYMLRSEANGQLIEEIEAGIKKEVSVGCSVSGSFCSICGARAGECGHEKGRRYDGKLCYTTLTGAVDAYEWSFVAVPAQRGAGVTKALPAPEAEGQLQKEAALGRRYLAETRAEVGRLALLCGRDLYDAVAPTLPAMEPEQLLTMRTALEKRLAQRLPVKSQFPGGEEALQFNGAAYLV